MTPAHQETMLAGDPSLSVITGVAPTRCWHETHAGSRWMTVRST